jgi:DNA-binding transcriptional LysR family regulator
MTTIDRRWLPLNALRAFEMVGRHQSFTAAAQALSVSQSAVSRHVIALEGLLGVALFERRPHAFALTEAGAALLPVVRKSFDRIEQTLNDVMHDDGARVRTLRVQLPPTFAHLLAVPMLREFRAACPDIILDIDSLNATGQSGRDTDAAVIYARPHVGEEVTSLLWMERLAPLCHPAVAARMDAGNPAAALARCELLHVHLEGEPRHRLWQMFCREIGASVDVERGLVFDTSILAAQYALSGEGIALLDREMFAADLEAGRLVAPFAAELESGAGYYLTVHPEDLADPAIAQFRTWMIQRFGRAAETRPALRVVKGG